jgi:protein ImuB
VVNHRSNITNHRLLEVRMFAALTCADSTVLLRVAREFSPRIESWSGGQELVLDLSGLARLFGEPAAIAEEICRTAAAGAVRVRVAIAATRAAARLLVRHHPGVTVVPPGGDAAALAPVPVDLLTPLHAGATGRNPREMDPGELVMTLKRWGLRTLGAFAALPSDEVAARLGQRGVRWQRVARGEDLEPLVPLVPEERFEQALELEWPIEGLEPLSFVLGRLLEPLSVQLERRDRGAARIHLRLRLVDRQEHVRSLELPIPMREARTLRTLLLLDLESHPPGAAIDGVTVTIDPTPGRVVQFSLLARPLPSPEQVSTLMARLHALMGEARCGSPGLVDSWQPGAFVMTPFQPEEAAEAVSAAAAEAAAAPPGKWSAGPGSSDAAALFDSGRPVMALRRFRHPVIARVRVEAGKPSRVTTDRAGLAGGRVESCAGPWRTAGGWWQGTDAGMRESEGAGERKGDGVVRGGQGAEVRKDSAAVRDGSAARWTGPGADAVVRGGGGANVWQGAHAAVRAVGAGGSDRVVRGFEGAEAGSGGTVREVERAEVRNRAAVAWDRDEWDVTLSDGATYRIFRERGPGRWFIEGVVD